MITHWPVVRGAASKAAIGLVLTLGAVILIQRGGTPAGIGESGEEKRQGEREARRGIVTEERRAYLESLYYPESLDEVLAQRIELLERGGLRMESGPPDPRLMAGRWTSVGPYGMYQPVSPFHIFSGLILTVAMHKDNSNIVYLGTAAGGAWKSTNAGASWYQVLDTLLVPTVGAIGASTLAADNLVYLGTGADPSGVRGGTFNQGFLYRSTNAGESWTRVTSFPQRAYITKIVLDYFNKNIIYVGTDAGLLKSTDGGATWVSKRSGNVTDVAVYSDLFSPGAAIVHVAIRGLGVFRSTNGGDTFASSAVIPATAQQPLVGRISLANHQLHSTIYAVMSNGGNGILGVWRSRDKGGNWTQVTDPLGGGGFQGFRNNAIAVAPNNGERVLIGWDFRTIFYSTNGGVNWNNSSWVHEDIQTILFDSKDSRNVIHVSDGGVFKSTDYGVTWKIAGGNYLPLAQVYHLTPDPTDSQSKTLWIGTQDNGLARGYGEFLDWTQRSCCDGGDILVFKGYVYTTIETGNDSGANRWQRTPIGAPVNDPWEPFTQGLPVGRVGLNPPPQIETDGVSLYTQLDDTVYVATNGNLPWRPLAGRPTTTGSEVTWFMPSTLNKLVYVGTLGGSENLRVYDPGIGGWRSPVSGFPPSRVVTGISVGATSGGYQVVFVALSGTSGGRLYRSNDGGENWVNVSAGIPTGVNVRAVLADRGNPNVVYFGSDLGIWGSLDAGTTWVNISDGLPPVPYVTALAQLPNNDLVAATFGLGVFTGPRGVPVSAGTPESLPAEFALLQNFPNPFNPQTEIAFDMPERAHAVLTVFDATGREVATLQDGVLGPGRHAVRWNSTRHASGVYYYRLSAGTRTLTRKMVLVR